MSEKLTDQRANFQRFMKQRNLTAYSWAKLAGITEGTIRSFLSGRSISLTYNTLEKLANAVNVLPSEILTQETPKIKAIESENSIDKNYLIDCMDQIDNIIALKNLSFTNKEKQKLYFSLYDLKKNIGANKKNISLTSDDISYLFG